MLLRVVLMAAFLILFSGGTSFSSGIQSFNDAIKDEEGKAEEPKHYNAVNSFVNCISKDLVSSLGDLEHQLEIKLYMDRSSEVSKYEIVDQIRYNSDEEFRASSDTLINIVAAKGCDFPVLPEDTFDEWKEIKLIFDPKAF